VDTRSGQFVIHRHTTAAGVHWDLMLEAGPVLWTWRILVPPEQIGVDPVSAERIADHPLRFLNYEGPVQKNTAHVKKADQGVFFLIEQSDQSILFELKGTILSGPFELIRREQNKWILRRPVPPEGG
jgi:hypothetical protein